MSVVLDPSLDSFYQIVNLDVQFNIIFKFALFALKFSFIRSCEYTLNASMPVFNCLHLTERLQKTSFFLRNVVESFAVTLNKPDENLIT